MWELYQYIHNILCILYIVCTIHMYILMYICTRAVLYVRTVCILFYPTSTVRWLTVNVFVFLS